LSQPDREAQLPFGIAQLQVCTQRLSGQVSLG
jgi:hypothetical protein